VKNAKNAKDKPILFSGPMVRAILEGRKTVTRRIVKPEAAGDGSWAYGVPGDRLWVREAWGLLDTEPKDGPEKATVLYRATDGERHDLRYQLWRPSIFMPRWASRLTLALVSVRVEMLQAITEEDALAEGFQTVNAFAIAWDQINAGGADPDHPGNPNSWVTNPWVWRIEFRRLA
jgi:hypothetical protein